MIKFQESTKTVHEEATKKRIDRDERDARKIINVIEEWRNPFESSDDLVCLSSGSVARKEVSDALLGAFETGTTVAEEFIKKRIIAKSVQKYGCSHEGQSERTTGNPQSSPKFVCQIGCDWIDTVNGYA